MTRSIVLAAVFGVTIGLTQERNEISPPSGWATWPIADNCGSALQVFAQRNSVPDANRLFKSDWYYFEGNTPVSVRRDAPCAFVTVGDQDSKQVSGWIAEDLLLKMTPEQERKAADEKARAVKQAADAKVQAAKQAADEKTLAALFAASPIVDSGTRVVFFGADRKCSEQFVQAIATEGIEGRKKLAELVTFGCGFTDDSRLHVKRYEVQGSSCRVIPIEGKHQGSAAWVPCAWLKGP